MVQKQRIVEMLEVLLPICESWLQEEEGSMLYVDPNDGVEISAHYGATHMAATLILYGKMKGKAEMMQKGLTLLDSILCRWEQSKKLPAFHFDFNNFALCVIVDVVKDDDTALYQRIQQTVLNTEDSNHDTINWLPMRWYVNQKRFEWTDDIKFAKRCTKYRRTIEKATNADGGIEDRLPKGISFNLQYDVATVGVLQFLRQRGVDYDLSKELRFLLNAVAPDGDINYQGRGMNQIFAWGLWVYLLATSGREKDLNVALDFLDTKVQKMYQNHNLMLNDYEGKEKYLWWDYHYCSVYCAHFLFWLTLALQDYGNAVIQDYKGPQTEDTGLHIYRSDDAFIATFDGRKEYLAENGPVVCAIWTQKHGMITKGTFGPWQGAFGQKYANETVLRNFWGIITLSSLADKFQFPLVKRLLNKLSIGVDYKQKQVFQPLHVNVQNGGVDLLFLNTSTSKAFANIQVNNDIKIAQDLSLHEGERDLKLVKLGMMRNQYGWYQLYQSECYKGDELRIHIQI